MSTQLKLRRGTTAQHSTFTGAEGEVTVDTTKDTLVVHDGTTAGGNPLVKENQTSPQTLSVNTTSNALRITQLGTGNALLVEDSTNPDSTPFVIDAVGSVITGHTQSQTIAGAAYQYQMNGSNPFSAIRWNSSNSLGLTALLGRSRSGTVGVNSIVAANDVLGTLTWAGDDGTAFVQAASISAAVDGTPGTNDMPGRLVFSTTADGASAPTERMRINSSGNVGIGTSSMTRFFNLYDTTTNAQTAYFKSTQASGGAGFVAYNNGGEAATFQINGSSNTSYAGANSVNIGSITNNNLAFITNNTERARIDTSGNLLVNTTSQNDSAQFSLTVASGKNGIGMSVPSTAETGNVIFRNPNGVVGRIYTSGSNTSYATSSDYRLKEDIAPMTGALAKVALLKPCTYKWKVDGSDGQGFIAHELAEVEAGCVTGEKDAVDADGNPQYQGIDTSFLVATLTAAIQEQQTLITALTARIDILEQGGV